MGKGRFIFESPAFMRAFFVCALAALLPSAAPAAPAIYEFVGTVTAQYGGAVAVGQHIPIQIMVDKSFAATEFGLRSRVYEGYPEFGGAGPLVSASFNGVPVSLGIDGITMQRNLSHVSQVMLFSSYPELGPGFLLTFTSNTPASVPSFRIPSCIKPGQFQTATFSYGSGAPNFTGYSGTVSAPPIFGCP